MPKDARPHATEVKLNTLRAGDGFDLLMDTGRARRGYLCHLTNCSASVFLLDGGRTTEWTTPEGKRVLIRRPYGLQHWDIGTLVAPNGEKHGLEKYNSLSEKENNMGTEPGSVKTKKERKAAKAKAPKVKSYLVAKYTVTAKLDTEKNAPLLDKANVRYAAVICRGLKAAKEPLTFPEVLQLVRDGGVKRDPKSNLENNVRWYVTDLSKKGIVKTVEDKVEAASRDEARAAVGGVRG